VGLEAVELLLAVEEMFEIDIPDADAAQLLTVGQLADYIAVKQLSLGRDNVNANIILDQLRTLIPYHLNVKPELVTASANFKDLYDFL
jgi:hypothetical protein